MICPARNFGASRAIAGHPQARWSSIIGLWIIWYVLPWLIDREGRELLATLVTVPELDGTFIELETVVPEAELAEALEVVRTTLRQLGITDSDLTTEQYTDAVLATRGTLELP